MLSSSAPALGNSSAGRAGGAKRQPSDRPVTLKSKTPAASGGGARADWSPGRADWSPGRPDWSLGLPACAPAPCFAAPPIPPCRRPSAASGVIGRQPRADGRAGGLGARRALWGRGRGPFPRPPEAPEPPQRAQPARERPRSPWRPARGRRHGCHDGSEVSLRATAAGAGAPSPGSAAAPAGGTRHAAHQLLLSRPSRAQTLSSGPLPPRLSGGEWLPASGPGSKEDGGPGRVQHQSDVSLQTSQRVWGEPRR